MSDSQEEGPEFEGGGAAKVLLPFLSVLIAAAVGLLLGAVVMWAFMRGEPEMVEVPRELTAAELDAACASLVLDATSKMETAQAKVTELEGQVRERETRVQELESEMAARGKRGAALVRQLEEARTELERVKAELEQAKAEKAQLVEELRKKEVELADTKLALEDQKGQTRQARDESHTNLWSAFVKDGQLLICEKGNRKRLGKCREKVAEVLGPAVRDRFVHCLRSNQAVPALKEMRKGGALPQFGMWLDQDDKITEDWFLEFCDPTLPEATEFAGEGGSGAEEPVDLGD